MSSVWPSGASGEMMTEEEVQLWHWPALMLCFNLCSKLGDSLWNPNNLPPAFYTILRQRHQLSGLLEGVNRISSCCVVPHWGIHGLFSWDHCCQGVVNSDSLRRAARPDLTTAFQQSRHPVLRVGGEWMTPSRPVVTPGCSAGSHGDAPQLGPDFGGFSQLPCGWVKFEKVSWEVCTLKCEAGFVWRFQKLIYLAFQPRQETLNFSKVQYFQINTRFGDVCQIPQAVQHPCSPLAESI